MLNWFYDMHDPLNLLPNVDYWHTDYIWTLPIKSSSSVLENCHLFEDCQQLNEAIKIHGWTFYESTPMGFLQIPENTSMLLYVNHYQLKAFPSRELIEFLISCFTDFDCVTFGHKVLPYRVSEVTKEISCFQTETVITKTTTLMLTLYAKKTIYLPKQEC